MTLRDRLPVLVLWLLVLTFFWVTKAADVHTGVGTTTLSLVSVFWALCAFGWISDRRHRNDRQRGNLADRRRLRPLLLIAIAAIAFVVTALIR